MQNGYCVLHVVDNDQVLNEENLISSAYVNWKRPSDVDADFVLSWPDQSQNVRTRLPLKGRWQLEFQGLYDGKIIRAKCDVFIEH